MRNSHSARFWEVCSTFCSSCAQTWSLTNHEESEHNTRTPSLWTWITGETLDQKTLRLKHVKQVFFATYRWRWCNTKPWPVLTFDPKSPVTWLTTPQYSKLHTSLLRHPENNLCFIIHSKWNTVWIYTRIPSGTCFYSQAEKPAGFSGHKLWLNAWAKNKLPVTKQQLFLQEKTPSGFCCCCQCFRWHPVFVSEVSCDIFLFCYGFRPARECCHVIREPNHSTEHAWDWMHVW